ncbi:DUF3298 domain-containing protein [Dokdonia sinensis]|uniref:DUF3298 domain-containing protein n=1 Tax=Dokdonia sinensis TaxID=2479847 RepID=A0A3M0GIL9_9FLAO|nr:RsiV family protein [Dokdonia sinensis]RMB64118.1 DUF3298 domain-containing protein [Dokdonia sinensis]
MKSLVITLALLSILSCKEQTSQIVDPLTEETTESILDPDSADSLYFTETEIRELQAKSQSLKKEGLLAIEDDIPTLQEAVQSKKIFKEADEYVLDYTYPYLNEEIDARYKKFNDYMAESYLNIERTVNQILEDKELLCDTLRIQRFRDKRIIDFKLHSTHNNLISILLYKENYYSGMLHSTYMFDCLNYDVNKQEFITYNDFFLEGSEKMVFDLINQTIYDDIHSGEMYYDCWEISDMDFRAYKNNFVVNGDNIEFYFDDCVICPSYTGQYSVIIPIPEIMHLIKGYQRPLLI